MKRKAGRFLLYMAAVFCLLTVFPRTAAAEQPGESSVGEEDTAQMPQELKFYLIPMGSTGVQNGQLWVYAEVYGEDGKPRQGEDWTVAAEITRTDPETKMDVPMVPVKDGVGYRSEMSLELTNATESEGKDEQEENKTQFSIDDYSIYQITVTVQCNGETPLTVTENLPNCICEWPKLRTEKWEASDEDAAQAPDILFDWTDLELFGRIFTVTLDHVPDSLETKELENGVWEIRARRDTDAELQVKLTDLMGNTSDSAYYVKITTGSTVLIIVFVVLAAALAVLICALVFGWKGGKSTPIFSEDISIKNQQDSLDEVYDDLEKAAARLKNKQRKYQELVEKDPDFMGESEKTSSGMETDYSQEMDDYEQARERLNSYFGSSKKYASEWNREDTKKYFNQIVRKLADKRNEFQEQENKLDEKILRLGERRRKRDALRTQMQRYLEKTLHITVRTDAEEYCVNKEKIDRGFALDECSPLIVGRDYAISGQTFGEIFGQPSGIRFYSDPEHRLWMECEFPQIFRLQGDSLEELSPSDRELCECGTRMQFLWKTDKTGEAFITIETEA
ncbi:MAG TPA: hypothetical protein H9734_02480 [Candidatus Fusicatenibacter merdavium]|uniref:Ig-like domain-containing protein n=1 Tax=Candidatus Fusicatenibacter merdavium TaxID=2838600 RepID=A0A9D2BHK0_9FIRM|nr:hypothetical protein [Candidatus Fusicatenibacter merdavium]